MALRIKNKPLRDLHPYPNNPRQHTEAQIDQVAASIQEFGWTVPILIDDEDGIVAGHARAMAAEKLKIETVPTILLSGLSEAQKRAYIIADNKLTENSYWDNAILSKEIQALLEADFSPLITGFAQAELDFLTYDFLHGTEGETDPDDVPEVQKEIVTKPGDVWLCGRHRVRCGDSTKAEDVEALMVETEADLLFTSPPYNQQRDYKTKIGDWDALMSGVFSIMPMKAGANVLVNLGLIHEKRRVNQYWDDWLVFMSNNDWPLFGWYVWDQGHGMPGNWNGRLAPSHEFVFHFCLSPSQSNKWLAKKPENVKAKFSQKGAFRQKDGSLKPIYSGQACAQPTKIADSVIRVNRAPSEAAKSGHPATFPVALCDYIYKSFAKAGDVIYDPFCGAGTSMIACETFGAKLCGMEIAPQYVDVAVRRWQDFTGKEATLEGDGKTFEKIIAKRKTKSKNVSD